MEERPRKVVLVIADISGYTKFMTAHRAALSHAQAIITDLMNSIIAEINIPLRVAEVEGDAVFFLGAADEETGWDEVVGLIRRKYLDIFRAFYRKLGQLLGSNLCECAGCKSVATLRLKMIIHVGEGLFYEVAGFRKISGPDVILVHRLLKNHVQGHEYVLMTASAFAELAGDGQLKVSESREEYPDLGSVKVFVSYPNLSGREAELERAVAETPSYMGRLAHTMKIMAKGLLYQSGLRKPPQLRNLMEPEGP